MTEEGLDEHRDDAWAVLLHDLRTPITIAQGRAQLLQRRLHADGAIDRERILTDLALIDSALHRLTNRLLLGGAFVEAGSRRRFLGGRLAAARRKAGLSQRALARAAGLSHGTVARLERGDGRMPRLATIHRMATALGVAPEDLIAWEPDPDWQLVDSGGADRP